MKERKVVEFSVPIELNINVIRPLRYFFLNKKFPWNLFIGARINERQWKQNRNGIVIKRVLHPWMLGHTTKN